MTAPQSGTDPISGRPGGRVNGIGWVALFYDLPMGTAYQVHPDAAEFVVRARAAGPNVPVIVTRWADGTVPTDPSTDPTGGAE